MTTFIRSNPFNNSCILKMFHISSNPTARYSKDLSSVSSETDTVNDFDYKPRQA